MFKCRFYMTVIKTRDFVSSLETRNPEQSANIYSIIKILPNVDNLIRALYLLKGVAKSMQFIDISLRVTHSPIGPTAQS